MFIDSAKIYVKAGSGGRGCQSLYKDKYKRQGIPDGGDGGRGADVVIKADRNLHTLLDFQFNRHFYGHHGGHGSGKKKKGKDAPAIIVRVPCGVIVKDIETDCVLASLDHDQDELLVAEGGKGGRGNRHYQDATEGEICEEKEILLDLKLIADVGVVGFPNAGKSTLISAVSNAHPQIAAYPFTTKFPILGVVQSEEKPFVIADIPGLIEGSWQGRGLGDKFLRHIERTKVLIHLIDMSGQQGRDPLNDYRIINEELKQYSKEVYRKPQIVAANKMDVPGSQDNLQRCQKAIRKKIYPVSALEKQGLEELIVAVRKKIPQDRR